MHTKLAINDLWYIARVVLDCTTCMLWNRPINQNDIQLLDHVLKRFLADEPMSRIVGWNEFCGNRFCVTPAVLDPRPETELIVEYAKQLKFSSVLELGVGSGCIICSITLTRNNLRALAVDISTEAIDIARYNANILGVSCEFKVSDWCSNVDEKFDLVVSNPPYVATNAGVNRDVWAYDPRLALDGGFDGCEAHRIALPQAKSVLATARNNTLGNWIRSKELDCALCKRYISKCKHFSTKRLQ